LPPVVVANGSAKFDAPTTISAISVHGESNAISGSARVSSQGGALRIEIFEGRLDPATLKTGIDLRDRHMRDKIFAEGGGLPELYFVAANAQCNENSPCQVNGQFTLRGVTRPVMFMAKVHNEGSKGYRVAAEGTLDIKTFGIEVPCQLGVCMT